MTKSFIVLKIGGVFDSVQDFFVINGLFGISHFSINPISFVCFAICPDKFTESRFLAVFIIS